MPTTTLPVVCLETQQTYPSTIDAAIAVKPDGDARLTCKAIERAIKSRGSAYRYHWAWSTPALDSVLCVETGESYPSLDAAAAAIAPDSNPENVKRAIGNAITTQTLAFNCHWKGCSVTPIL